MRGVHPDCIATPEPVSDARCVPFLPFGNRDAALPEATGIKRSFLNQLHDPAWLLHDEAQCDD